MIGVVLNSAASTTISSLNRADASPSTAATVNWTATFASAVYNVAAANFSLTGTATSGAVIGTPTTSDSGFNWNIPVTTGTGTGTLQLNLANSTSMSASISTSLPFSGQSYTMDRTPPSAPVFTGITTDTGTSSSDRITSDQTLILNGTAEASSTVSITRVGTGVIGSATTTGGGTWSFDYTGTTLPAGSYSFTATATDTVGNTSSDSSSFAVTVDTSAPAAPAFTGITTDTGSSSSDRITRDQTLILSGTAEASSTISVTRVGTGVIGSATTTGGGTWSFNYTGTTLPSGSYSFTATATDAAGNVSSTSSSFAVTIDTTAPAAPVFTGITTDTGSSSSDQITSDQTLTLNGTAEAGSSISIARIGTGLIGTTTTTGGGTWSFNYATTLPAGSYSFIATATDVAGNTSSTSASFAVTIDTTGPAPSISAPSTGSASSGPVTYTITYAPGDTITLAGSDVTLNTTGDATGTIGVSGTGNTRTITISSISGTGSLGISLLANTATDVAGNAALAAGPSTTFVVDNTNDAPTIAGSVANQLVDDNATVAPFTGVTIGDTDLPVQTLAVTISLDDAAKGAFTTLNGFTNAGGGSYTFSGTADDVTTAIRGLVFDPSDNRGLPGTTETNTFTIVVNDGQANPTTNDTTTVISTSINDAPIATADSIQRRSGTTVKVAVAQLLGNDSDPENETLTLSLPAGLSANGATITREGRWVIYSAPVSDAVDTFQYTVSDGSGGNTPGTVTVTVQTDTAQSQNIVSIVADGNDTVLTFMGIAGIGYDIQYTTDLSGAPTWNTLSTQTAGIAGVFQYRDVNPPAPGRFYRTLVP